MSFFRGSNNSNPSFKPPGPALTISFWSLVKSAVVHIIRCTKQEDEKSSLGMQADKSSRT
ncbi:MAG: hypothetical protein Q9216_005194, partial [Gyalolechia sp. 2 TL-2023]